jgi:hypothetical protein
MPQSAQANLSEALNNAAAEFNRHERRSDGVAAVNWLDRGLTILRSALYLRVHQDVELMVGRDSMLMPVSEMRTVLRANQTIEAYQIAESAAAAMGFHYTSDPEGWYLNWLARIRLGDQDWSGEIVEQTKSYLPKTTEQRRSAFSDEMARIVHEAASAPLVLFRLLPLAVQIITARAFDDRKTADDLRRRQIAILPSVEDCRHCKGEVLNFADQCTKCGNPLWTYEWLTEAD